MTAYDERESQRELMARKRAADRDITIPDVVNPERRAAALADPLVYLKTYFPDWFYCPFTDGQKQIVEAILHRMRYGGDQSIADSRGGGKTLIATAVCMYGLKIGLIDFALIVAANASAAIRVLNDLKVELESNDLLHEDFPEICAPIRALERSAIRAKKQTHNGAYTNLKWEKDEIVFADIPGSPCSGAVFKTVGIDGAVRGMRVGSKRPRFVLLDDVETRESARSPAQIDARCTTIDSDIAGLSGPDQETSRLLLCTLLASGCVADIYTDPQQKPSFSGIRNRLIVKWPDDRELWDTYIGLRQKGQRGEDESGREAHQFYLANREAMDAGSEVSNPYRFVSTRMPDGSQKEVSTLQSCYNLIADDGLNSFLTEYQNDPPEDDKPVTGTITEMAVRERFNGLSRKQIPDGAQLVAMVDIGQRRIHYAQVAWLSDGRFGHIVDYGEKLTRQSDIVGAEIAVRAALDELAHEWKGLPLTTALVDCGWLPNTVFEFCRAVGAPWRPSHGDPQFSMPEANIPGKKRIPKGQGEYYESRNVKGRAWVINFEASYWKHRVHSLFQAENCGLTLFGDAPGEHTEFAKHITAEIWTEETLERPTGRVTRKYFRTIRNDNHYLDCIVGCCVAGAINGVFGWRKKPRRNQHKDLRPAEPTARVSNMFKMLGPPERPSVTPK